MKQAFTIVEMATVIVIIGILSGIVIIAAFTSLEKSRIIKSQADLVSIKSAVSALYMDTSRIILGCPPYKTSNPEAPLDESWSPPGECWVGLVCKPEVGVAPSPPYPAGPGDCEWTAESSNSWTGPYIDTQNVRDYWGNAYSFDPDYHGCCGWWIGNIPMGQVGIIQCEIDFPDCPVVTECKQILGDNFLCPDGPPLVILGLGQDQITHTCDDIITGLTLKD